jgi:FkbM family methyltransferase
MSFSEQYFLDKEIKNVLHVGADRGGELYQYRAIGVEKVVWIEANPEVYNELLENLVIMNIPEIKSLPYNVLISNVDDVDTEFNLYYNWDAGHLVGNKGMSSMLKVTPDHWSASCFRGSLTLPSLRLDTFLERNNLGYDFDMLNMDVQGAELMVCDGGPKVLDNVKYINIEVTFHSPQYVGNPFFPEVNDYLLAKGFTHIGTELSDPSWGDAIFARV